LQAHGADFTKCLIFECDLTGTTVSGADFRQFDADSTFFLRNGGEEVVRLSGKAAIGYLKYQGAKTDDVEDFFWLQHHPKFSIIIKICEPLTQQRNNQLRGLTQRGEAHKDPPFARAFVQYLRQNGLVEIDFRNLVSATPEGRNLLPKVLEDGTMPEIIRDFLIAHQ
jgi:hypothetical protein